MRKHVDFDESELRKMVVIANRKTGASLPFLKDDSTDNFVKPSINGKQRKCFQIPHSALHITTIRKLTEQGSNNCNNMHVHIFLLNSWI